VCVYVVFDMSVEKMGRRKKSLKKKFGGEGGVGKVVVFVV